MIYLVILCEGPTEVNFVQQLLSVHLISFDINCQPILLAKKVKNDNPSAPGGVIKYEPVYKHIQAALRQYSSESSYVTTMLDLYAFPNDFPNYDNLKNEPNPVKRVEGFENALFNEMRREIRFIPNIQLFEFESLIFTHLDELIEEFPGVNGIEERIDTLKKDVEGLAPEEINQTREGSPSHRILSYLPSYRKTIMGPSIIQRIGLAKLRENCPHFGSWLTRLENLGSKLY